MKRMLVGCFTLLSACNAFATITGLPTDILEPSWRGQPNTTLQAWSFDTGDNPAFLDPSLVMNQYGTPSAEVFVPDTGFPKHTYWMADDNGYDGVWRIYGDDYCCCTFQILITRPQKLQKRSGCRLLIHLVQLTENLNYRLSPKMNLLNIFKKL